MFRCFFNIFYNMNKSKTKINEWKPSNYDGLPDIIKLYHGTDINAMNDIIEDGVISARNGRQHGETNGINWFSTKLTGNFGTGTYFSIEVPKSDFEDYIFNFMNSGEVTSSISEIPIDKYNMRIEKLNGVPLRKFIEVYKQCDGDIWEMQDITINWDKEGTFQLTIPSYRYIIEQEFGKNATNEYYEYMNESVTNTRKRKSKKGKGQYVNQGIMLPIAMNDMCISENIINEVDAEDINLASFQPQDELNPKIWINGKINSRVRLKLLDLADEFYDSLAVGWVKPKDIVLTGSLANYNWSKYSDIDVHILIDYKKIWKKTEFVEDYFKTKKQQWSEEHEGLKIYGFPVELFVEDVNNDNPNTGIYSLNKNKWLVEPNDFQNAEMNEGYIKRKSAEIMTTIDDAEDVLHKEKDNHKLEVTSTKVKKIFDKLVRQRKESLKTSGEMGTYNIIWKVLRRTGYLDKMWEIINTIYNKVNSIKEGATRHKSKINEAMSKDFSFEYLSKLNTQQAIEYCNKELGEIVGEGSSRAVYQIDDVQVLKLALNHKGIAQNRVEASTKQMKSPLFPYVLYVDDNYKWLVTEYVLPAKEEDFEHCLGIDDCVFFVDVLSAIKRLKHQGGMAAYEEKFVPYYGDSDFYRALAHYISNYDIPIGDLEIIDNWGLAKRNGKEALVILDDGWNKETMQLYGGAHTVS